MEGVPHADDILTLVGEERNHLSLLGVVIPPLNGIVVAPVLAWRLGARSGRPRSGERPELHF